MQLRSLGAGSEASVDGFQAEHADSSMFLRYGLQQGGLVDQGMLYQGSYVGGLAAGQLVGVAAHYWTGIVPVQAPVVAAARLASEALRVSRRPLTGVSGPDDQVTQVLDALGLRGTWPRLHRREGIFALDILELTPPASVAGGELSLRPVGKADFGWLRGWYADYEVEAYGGRRGEDLDKAVVDRLRGMFQREAGWIALEGERPVATVSYVAALPDIVQVGGVYTVPEARGRGCGAAAVAMALQMARERGGVRATSRYCTTSMGRPVAATSAWVFSPRASGPWRSSTDVTRQYSERRRASKRLSTSRRLSFSVGVSIPFSRLKTSGVSQNLRTSSKVRNSRLQRRISSSKRRRVRGSASSVSAEALSAPR
ncbi:MAG: GNAT family N-acetyltransferase [Myxococcales bacterium]|nr:GNAT family N-acetyltransferase [Myxococcales bacterium]